MPCLTQRHVCCTLCVLCVWFLKAFVIVTSIVLVLLGILGFSSTRHTLFISDKPLHFICFAFSTALFYWIWDVEEYSRRIWYWRRAPTIITSVVCFFCVSLFFSLIVKYTLYAPNISGDLWLLVVFIYKYSRWSHD